MEELLNKLIEKGWRPFGDNAIKFDYDWMKTRFWYWAITYKYRDSYIDDDWDEVEYEEWKRQFNLRELVSKESWLWQFCCRNKLVDWKPEWIKTCGWIVREEKQPSNSHYRLIESALKDESELEKFLLENIKIS